MQSIHSFLVKPKGGRRYNNTKSIGDVDFIISISPEDHTVTNREAIVVSVPVNYEGDVKVGNTILVHHNVFRTYHDMKGRHRSGKSFFKDDLFLVDHDQFYLYDNGEGWKAPGKYCFIEPVTPEHTWLVSSFAEQPLVGKIRYINNELLEMGLQVGDRISFSPDSEYEFRINEEKLYRMFTENITIHWKR